MWLVVYLNPISPSACSAATCLGKASARTAGCARPAMRGGRAAASAGGSDSASAAVEHDTKGEQFTTVNKRVHFTSFNVISQNFKR